MRARFCRLAFWIHFHCQILRWMALALMICCVTVVLGITYPNFPSSHRIIVAICPGAIVFVLFPLFVDELENKARKMLEPRLNSDREKPKKVSAHREGGEGSYYDLANYYAKDKEAGMNDDRDEYVEEIDQRIKNYLKDKYIGL